MAKHISLSLERVILLLFSICVLFAVGEWPAAPQDVQIRRCASNYASIQWTPGNSHIHVTQFNIYYNTSFDDEGIYHKGTQVSGAENSARIRLSPWATYTFHVRAVNAVGMSEGSPFTTNACETPPARPYNNPAGVGTKDVEYGRLVIVWRPMPQIEHNGEGFHYVVTYRLRNIPGEFNHQMIVHDWLQSEVSILEHDVYAQEYEISVRAENRYGRAPAPMRMIGFSSEAGPLLRPTNFGMNWSTLNSTYAEFSWDHVDTSSEMIRGFFRGYRVYFWRRNYQSDFRIHEVILEDFVNGHPMDHPQRHHQTNSRVTAAVNNLWPNSTIKAAVVVLNGKYDGLFSNVIMFLTPYP